MGTPDWESNEVERRPESQAPPTRFNPVQELQNFLATIPEESQGVALPSVHHNGPQDFAPEPPSSPSPAIGLMPPDYQAPKAANALNGRPDVLNWSGYGTPGKGLLLDDGGVHTWDVNEYNEPHHQDMLAALGLPNDEASVMRHVPFAISPKGELHNTWDPWGRISPTDLARIQMTDFRLRPQPSQYDGAYGHGRALASVSCTRCGRPIAPGLGACPSCDLGSKLRVRALSFLKRLR